MKVKLCIIGLVLLLLLVRCSNEQEFNEILRDERIDLLIHQEKVDNGIVLFYVPNIDSDGDAIEARFIEKMLFGWEASLLHRGGGSMNPSIDLIPTIFIPNMSDQSLLFGLHLNEKIDEIKIEYTFENELKEVLATNVENNGKHMWFAFIDKPKSRTIFTIKGYFNGRLIETVEEDSYTMK